LDTELYWGQSQSGWNGGVWNELVTTSPVNFTRLHNFAPIIIANGVGQLNFELCGNGYYNSPYLSGQDVKLCAQIFIADCDQFYDYGGAPPSGVDWNTVFISGPDVADVSGVGTVCFKFIGNYNITEGCRYHAAVGLGIKTDYAGVDKNDFDLDFSYQLTVYQ
jgi:hypothetical protein